MSQKCVYINLVLHQYTQEKFDFLKNLSSQYGNLTIGIPSNKTMVRLWGKDRNGYDAEKSRSFWEQIKFIERIIILDDYDFGYQDMYEKLHFDICFYGSYYGIQFEKDKIFFTEKGVEFLPLLPGKLTTENHGLVIKMPLVESLCNKKIVLFGTGSYFDFYMNNYGSQFKPAYAIDNDESKWNVVKNGVLIKNPENLKSENADGVIVVICAKSFVPFVEQLDKIGKFDYRTLLFNADIAVLEELLYAPEENAKWQILKKVQQIDYNLLKEFDSICRKYGIKYFLNFGSLLGALRHNAIIPWDNDIDTVLKREDWDKVKIHKDELSGEYFWLGNDILGNRKYYDCLDRIAYKKAWIRMDENMDDFYGNNFNSIHLDMFLIDKTYDNFWGVLQRYELALLYGLMNAYRHKAMFFDYDKSMRFANSILCFLGKFISLKWLKKRADKVARRFDNCSDAPYYFISNDVLQKLKMLFPARIFDHAVDAPFGDMTSMIASGGDEMCRIIFGDYMQLPPESEREPHCGRIWMTTESYVFEEPERKSAYSK